ncbi:MAG: hypothetical protein ACE5DI_03970 [Candidatus Micrarchaeia archaeon]
MTNYQLADKYKRGYDEFQHSYFDYDEVVAERCGRVAELKNIIGLLEESQKVRPCATLDMSVHLLRGIVEKDVGGGK